MGAQRRKRFIGNAGLSDVYVVFARTGDDGAAGVSAFLVDGHAHGVSVREAAHDGHAGLAARGAALRGRRGPGREPDRPRGRRLQDRHGDLRPLAPTVAAQAVGLGQGAIDLAVDYALRRHAFGEPLLGHQGIQFKLADMEAEVAAARALTYQAATAVDEDDPRLTKLASMAKMMASDAAMRVTTEAVQVLGGNGYLKDFPAERMMRDAKVLQIYEGANEIQQLVIARVMAKEAQGREPLWPECMPGAEGSAGQGADGAAPEERSGTLARPAASASATAR